MRSGLAIIAALVAAGCGATAAAPIAEAPAAASTASAVAAPVPPESPAPTAAAAAAPVSHEGMVSIPAGRFRMGSLRGKPNETPVHEVDVAAFWMDVTEVTVAAYAACVRAGACEILASGDSCNATAPGREKHPINCIEWDRADAYCRWLGKRLPTEEEWEYAARGTDGREYPWGAGAAEGRLCWGRYYSKAGTCPVASFPSGKSPFGVQDMAGNVGEWTSSSYRDDYAPSSAGSMLRVVRGGGWQQSDEDGVRAPARMGYAPRNSSATIGFRCASP